MQELKIFDVHTDSDITINNMAEFPDALEIVIENGVKQQEMLINIFREDAIQIISFMKNHFNL